METKELLTIQEAAEILGVHECTAWRLTKAGYIPYVKIGKMRKVSRVSVQAFIDNGGTKDGANR